MHVVAVVRNMAVLPSLFRRVPRVAEAVLFLGLFLLIDLARQDVPPPQSAGWSTTESRSLAKSFISPHDAHWS
jgi:hypothetical protein